MPLLTLDNPAHVKRRTKSTFGSLAMASSPLARAAAAEPKRPSTRYANASLIQITEAVTTAALIRRGRRVADHLKADCIAVCVLPTGGMNSVSPATREAIEKHLNFAAKLHIDTRVLEGEDEASTLVNFARTNSVTQIFLAKPARSAFSFLNKQQPAMKVVNLAKEIQVTLVAARRKPAG